MPLTACCIAQAASLHQNATMDAQDSGEEGCRNLATPLLSWAIGSWGDPNTGAEHLFGRCGIRPGPSCRAAGPVGSDLALVFELFQDKPDGLVADAWHGCPDVGEAERDWRMAQDVLADALLLGSWGLR